jgi:hypothetical protein
MGTRLVDEVLDLAQRKLDERIRRGIQNQSERVEAALLNNSLHRLTIVNRTLCETLFH